MANSPTYLSKSLFVGPVNLDFGNYPEFNEFAYYIEQKYLELLLGYDLLHYVESNDWIASGPPGGTGDQDEIKEAYYTALLSGDSDGYEDSDGYLKPVRGFADLLKWFFYYHFVIEEENESTQSNPEAAYIRAVNGVKYIKNKKTVRAFNQGVDRYYECYNYMSYVNSQVSNTFDDWQFADIEKINLFGI